MSSQTYRSLDARGDALTVEQARDAGATDDADLARQFTDDGGSTAPAGAECLYAMTSYRGSERGVARFCFSAGSVDVQRQRSDLD